MNIHKWRECDLFLALCDLFLNKTFKVAVNNFAYPLKIFFTTNVFLILTLSCNYTNTKENKNQVYKVHFVKNDCCL